MLHTQVRELCNNKAYFLTSNLSLPLSFAMEIRAYRGQAETNMRMKCFGSQSLLLYMPDDLECMSKLKLCLSAKCRLS